MGPLDLTRYFSYISLLLWCLFNICNCFLIWNLAYCFHALAWVSSYFKYRSFVFLVKSFSFYFRFFNFIFLSRKIAIDKFCQWFLFIYWNVVAFSFQVFDLDFPPYPFFLFFFSLISLKLARNPGSLNLSLALISFNFYWAVWCLIAWKVQVPRTTNSGTTQIYNT